MNYALNIDKDTNRILSACIILPNINYGEMVMVENLPSGEDNDITNYLYVNNEYIYDPIPEEEVIYEPSAEEVLNALLGVEV